jgi:hypothetical protein
VSNRHRAVVARLTERIEAAHDLEGAFLIGSLARNAEDDVSDVDVFAVVTDGRFAEAWDARGALEGDEAVVAWDDTEAGRSRVGAHKWLTHDLVLVECLLAERTSGARLADPMQQLTGPPDLAERVPRRDAIPRDVVDDYARGRIEAGLVHPVALAYAELSRAVREAARQGP